MALNLDVPEAFEQGAPILSRLTCEREDRSPPLAWTDR